MFRSLLKLRSSDARCGQVSRGRSAWPPIGLGMQPPVLGPGSFWGVPICSLTKDCKRLSQEGAYECKPFHQTHSNTLALPPGSMAFSTDRPSLFMKSMGVNLMCKRFLSSNCAAHAAVEPPRVSRSSRFKEACQVTRFPQFAASRRAASDTTYQLRNYSCTGNGYLSIHNA